MIVSLLGILHLFHCPGLLLFPFLNSCSRETIPHILDVIYIIYFFFIMILYTFIEGECPISYLCKKIIHKDYVAGDDINYYPEMEIILPNREYINNYFLVMTISYILALLFVIYRTSISFDYFVIPFFILFIYFLLIRQILVVNKTFFNYFQEFTKYVLLITICFLLQYSIGYHSENSMNNTL